jgi:hypothetical protein
MNKLSDESEAEIPVIVTLDSLIRFVGGMILLLTGVGLIVGGIILHFAEKAGHLFGFPFVGRLTILFGIGLSCGAIALAGWRMAVGVGTVTLVVGIGMLGFGYYNLAEPSLRFYAPLGFFIALAGGFLIWGGREYAREVAKPSKPAADPLE